jgi:hypothetical protein
VAGSPHARFTNDFLPPGVTLEDVLPSPRQTPISVFPEVRKRLQEGLDWVRSGTAPGPSVVLAEEARDGGGAYLPDPTLGFPTGVARDAAGNAIPMFVAHDATGTRSWPAPPHPAIALGEARFQSFQSFDNFFAVLSGRVAEGSSRAIGDDGFFADFASYRKAFRAAVAAQLQAGLILPLDAERLRQQADAAPPLTFTESFLTGAFD